MVEVLIDFLIDFQGTCVSCADTDMIDFWGTSVSCTDTDILKEFVVKLDDLGPMKT